MTDQKPEADQKAVSAALVEGLKARYPDRFNAEQIEQIGQNVERLQDSAALVRSYPLTNADEPDFVFTPIRKG